MTQSPFGYRLIDHTADIAMNIQAEILPDIYNFAARGLFDTLVGLESIKPRISSRIEVTGMDLEELLVKMLSELLFRFTVKARVYCEFIVEYLDHERLVLFARGEDIDPDRHVIRQEIKAATYHGLEISPTDDGFETTIVFDV